MKVDDIQQIEFLKKNTKKVIALLISNKQEQQELQSALLVYDLILNTEVSPTSAFSSKKASYFKDSNWNLIGREVNPRASDVSYSIDWSRLEHVPDVVVFKLKLLALHSLINPSLLSQKKQNLSMQTISRNFGYINLLFGRLFESVSMEHGEHFVNQFTEISNIDEDIFKNTAKEYFWNILKTQAALSPFERDKVWNIFNEEKPKYLSLKDLPFRDQKKSSEFVIKNLPEQKYFEVGDFRKLTEMASLYVVDFLNVVNCVVNCNLSKTMYEKAVEEERFKSCLYSSKVIATTCFKTLFSQGFSTKDYVKSSLYSRLEIGELFESPSDLGSFNNLPKGYKNLGTEADVRSYIMKVQSSALFLIGAYTGMRPDEFLQIKFDESLVERDVGLKSGKMRFVKTTILKGRDRTSLFNDEFIAIDIVVDAMNLIKELNKMLGYTGVFCTQFMNGVRKHSAHSSKAAIQRFINDTLEAFSNEMGDGKSGGKYQFYPYMLRHNFAYQLYREELELVAISFAMKHVVTGIDRFKKSSSVTLGYGELGDRLSGGSNVSKELRKAAGLEAVKNQFDPNGAYVGGGAEEYKRSLVRSFQAYTDIGYDYENVFEMIYEQGYPVLNMGIAYCQANDIKNESSGLPCMGGLECSVECEFAVQGKEHIPRLIEINLSAMSVRDKAIQAGLKLPEYKQAQIERAIDITSCSLNKLDVGEFDCGR